MVEAALFIGTVIIAVTQIIKYFVPKVSGVVTIFVSALVGGIIGLVDIYIGVADVSIAQGVLIGLGASGVVYTAGRVNTGERV